VKGIEPSCQSGVKWLKVELTQSPVEHECRSPMLTPLLSIVPFDVMNKTIPPGRTLSKALAKK